MTFFKGGALSPSGACTGLGSRFDRLVAYLSRARGARLDPRRPAWVSYRNLEGIGLPAQAAQVMRAQAGENPRVARPVYHFGLSLLPGEHLDREPWDRALDRVIRQLALADHQAFVAAHHDTGQEHVHVVVNRIGHDGRAWHPYHDALAARGALRHLEIEYGLKRSDTGGAGIPELSSPAHNLALRNARQPLADRVRDRPPSRSPRRRAGAIFERRLATHGVRLEPATRHSGLVVTDGSAYAALSRVDASLSGPKLALRFGETFLEHRQAHPEPPAILAPRPPAATPPPDASLERRAAVLIDRLTVTCATFTEGDLHRTAFYQPEAAALVRAALRSDQLLDLGKDDRGVSRYTTREYLGAEARLLAAAAALASRGHHRLDAAVSARPLDSAAASLAAAPRAAVLHATTGADLAQIVGPAGPARAGAVRAIAAAYEARGREVFGAALTDRAAAALQTVTGIRSRTLGDLEPAWAEGSDRPHPRSVLVLDEAGALSVRQLGRVLAHAEERGAKVILLGDPDRLSAIGAGDAFRGLLERHPSAAVETLHRLPGARGSWQPATPEPLAGGRVDALRDGIEPAAGHERVRRSARSGRKDLASDYAASDLRRAVDRLQEIAAQTVAATREQRPLREVVAAFDALRDSRLRVVALRRSVAAAAARVYADPGRALRGLLRDPAAPDRLNQGKVRAYGKLRSRAGLGALRHGPIQDRPAVASLTGSLYDYRRSLAGLRTAKQSVRAQLAANPNLLPPPRWKAGALEPPGSGAAGATPARLPRHAELRRELTRLDAGLRNLQAAGRATQDGIEAAIRGMGRTTLDSVLLLLPPKVASPVEAAARAVTQAIDRGQDLGLGLGR